MKKLQKQLEEQICMFLRFCMLDTVGKTHGSNDSCLHRRCSSLKTYLLSLWKTRMHQLSSSVWEKLIFKLSNCLLLQGQLYLFIFCILPHSKKGFEESEETEWHGSVRKKLETTFPNSTLFSEMMSSPYKDGKIAKPHTVKVKDSLLGNTCPGATVLPVHLWA